MRNALRYAATREYSKPYIAGTSQTASSNDPAQRQIALEWRRQSRLRYTRLGWGNVYTRLISVRSFYRNSLSGKTALADIQNLIVTLDDILDDPLMPKFRPGGDASN